MTIIAVTLKEVFEERGGGCKDKKLGEWLREEWMNGGGVDEWMKEL